MPTVSELKDQARALEQQGDFTRALAIYEHILKHVEGTPAIAKLIPLYVKVGDLQLKLDEPADAVAAYEKAASQYAQAGSAQRVAALCEKIQRISPDRTGAYLTYARELMEHGHAGSARDVLSAYAQLSGLDRALETLDDLAGRPNEEVAPMLERLLAFGPHLEPEVAEETAERLSSQLSQLTDAEAGELSLVSEPGPAVHFGAEPGIGQPSDEESERPHVDLTPHMIDFGVAPQAPTPTDVTPQDEEPVTIIRGSVELDPSAVTATPDVVGGVSALDVKPSWDADAVAGEQAAEPPAEPAEAEEEPSPRRGSIEWITSGGGEPAAEEQEEGSAATWEPSAADVEPAAEAAARAEEAPEPESTWAPAPPEPTHPREDVEKPVPTVAARREPRPVERPLRPTPSFMTHESRRRGKSPVIYGIVGFVLGLLVGVLLMTVFGGESADEAQAATGPSETGEAGASAQQPTGRDLPTAISAPNAITDSVAAGEADLAPATPRGEELDSVRPQARLDAATVGLPDSAAPAELPADATPGTPLLGSPVVVEGLAIESISETTHQERAGFRVIHLLPSGDQFTVESYAMGTDSANVPRSGRVTVNLTPPDTVVGVLRWEDYIVFASGVMPEDSLRALMARLTEGARPD